MNVLLQPVNKFLAEEAGYDLVEFAMAGALAASVATVAFKDKWSDIVPAVSSFFHSL
jgi:hypothetical protein